MIGLYLCRLAADPGEYQSVDGLESVERAEPLKRRLRRNSVTSVVCGVGEVHDRD